MVNDNQTESKTSQETTDLDACQQELQMCKQQVQEWKDKTIRMTADFENFKRRLEKDQAVWQYTFQAKILLDVLDVVDNFDRAFKDLDINDPRNAGFVLIYKNLKKLLDKYNVTEITENKHFDPTIHEAISTVEVEGKESGDIVEVLQKGYMFKDQVLRPAKVSIAQ
jgi:molecular chaperone GrpE